MTYNKPQIAVLGEAIRLIQDLSKNGVNSDGVKTTQPVYDLDE
jgi:hypothetical protein